MPSFLFYAGAHDMADVGGPTWFRIANRRDQLVGKVDGTEGTLETSQEPQGE